MTTIRDFTITRFSFRRDRIIGDSQVRADSCYAAALELHTDDGRTGLGFMLHLFHPLPDRSELERTFRQEALPGLRGQPPMGDNPPRAAPARRQQPRASARVRRGDRPGAVGPRSVAIPRASRR